MSEDAQLAQLRGRLGDAQRELETAVLRVEELERRLLSTAVDASTAQDIEARYQAYRHTSDAALAWHDRLARFPVELAERETVESEIAAGRHALEAEHDRLTSSIVELERATDGRAGLADRREALAVREASLAELEGQLEVLRARQAGVVSALTAATAAVVTVTERGRAVRQRQRTIAEALEACPTCGQPLSDELRTALRGLLETEVSALLAEHGAAQARQRAAEGTRPTVDTAVAALQRSLNRERQAIGAELAAFGRIDAAAEAASGLLQVAIEELEVVAATLATGGYAESAFDRLGAVDRALEAHGLPMAEYRQLRAELLRLAGAIEAHASLEVRRREAQPLRREVGYAEAEALRLGALVKAAAEALQRAAAHATHAHPAAGPHLAIPHDTDGESGRPLRPGNAASGSG